MTPEQEEKKETPTSPQPENPTAETLENRDSAPSGEKAKKKALLGRPIVLIGAALVLILLLVIAFFWWLHARHFETTDDAFIDAHIVRLAPQIGGRVSAVAVDDNQWVQAGQLLISIDSMDFQTHVARARAQRAQGQAQLENALGQIRVNEASYQQALAEVRAATARARDAASDLSRYRHLQALNPAALAQQQLDQAEATAAQAAAQRQASVRAAQVRAAELDASRTQVASGKAAVNAAQAEIDEAQLNLGYTRLVAPIAGHITQKSVALGAYVQPGTQVLAIVPAALFVTANFKETQLAYMRAGQATVIQLDACAGEKIQGHIDSIQRGAGQAFGILPPENATGNYVKVVQRVPVKIVLDNLPSDCVLGPGMSVEARVRVR